jgi:acyl-ACP thioesterase
MPTSVTFAEKKLKKIWKEQYAVNWDDISLDGKLSLTGLNIMLQRAATYHAEHLGFGFTQTSVYNASWVLFRINLELIRMPEWCDRVVVETWPRVVKGLAAYRDFIVTTPEGEVLCRATSEWFIIDLTSRRPQQIEKYVDVELYTMPTAGSPTDLSAEGMEAGKPTNRQAVTRDIPTLSRNTNYETLFEVIPKYSDMDMNGHTNARKYFDWLTDAMHQDNGKLNPTFVQMTYFSECTLGEHLVIQRNTSEKGLYRGQKIAHDKTAFVAMVEMRNGG